MVPARPQPAALPHAARSAPAALSAAHALPAHDKPMDDRRGDRQFVAMLAAYRATGGVARGDDLALVLEHRQQGDFVSLARRIVAGDIFSFSWSGTCWVPMFQLEPRDLTLKRGPRQVLAELGDVLDGWSLAVWFAWPNAWLNGSTPVELIDSHPADVVQAARADRFVATG
jgi:hypothetical protein